jgi:predicted transcriptional regulator
MVMTIDIPDAVVEKAKKLAEDRKATLSVIFSEGVEALSLSAATSPAVTPQMNLQSEATFFPTHEFGPLLVDIDLNSNASIYDFFDQEDYGSARR